MRRKRCNLLEVDRLTINNKIPPVRPSKGGKNYTKTTDRIFYECRYYNKEKKLQEVIYATPCLVGDNPVAISTNLIALLEKEKQNSSVSYHESHTVPLVFLTKDQLIAIGHQLKSAMQIIPFPSDQIVPLLSISDKREELSHTSSPILTRLVHINWTLFKANCEFPTTRLPKEINRIQGFNRTFYECRYNNEIIFATPCLGTERAVNLAYFIANSLKNAPDRTAVRYPYKNKDIVPLVFITNAQIDHLKETISDLKVIPFTSAPSLSNVEESEEMDSRLLATQLLEDLFSNDPDEYGTAQALDNDFSPAVNSTIMTHTSSHVEAEGQCDPFNPTFINLEETDFLSLLDNDLMPEYIPVVDKESKDDANERSVKKLKSSHLTYSIFKPVNDATFPPEQDDDYNHGYNAK